MNSERDAVDVLNLLVAGSEGEGPQEVPLRFVPHGAGLGILAPADARPRWVDTLSSGERARWRVGEREFEGTATSLGDRTGDVLAAFEVRFGRRRVKTWFHGRALGFVLRATRGVGPDLESRVEALFDAAAEDYDRTVEGNPLDRGLRRVSVHLLLRTFRPGERVIELGCGTGVETLPLARAGVEVLALDVSKRMLDRLDSKAAAEGLGGQIRTRKLRAADLAGLEAEFGSGSFAGAFSDFGAPNLETGWSRVPPALAALVRPGGRVVLAVWNRTCAVEMALYALRGRPARALARLRSPVPVGLSRFGVPAYAHSPGSFLRDFAPSFRVESLVGLPVLVPPYDFMPHLPAPDRIVPLLEAADERVRGRFPFNRLGDHFLAVLRRI